MSNQPIILRFFSEVPGEVPRISPTTVGAIASAIEKAYDGAASALRSDVSLRLYFAAAPAPGCLEIRLVTEVRVSQPPPEKSPLGQVAIGIGVVAALWVIVFGDKGAVDLLRQPDPARVAGTPHEIAVSEAKKAQGSTIRSLLDLCANSGATRVTLDLPEGPVLTLYCEGDRQDASLLARKSFEAGGNIRTDARYAHIRRVGSEVVEARLGGKPVKLFIAEVEHQPREGRTRHIAVWASRREPPTEGNGAEVKARLLRADERNTIKVDSPIPGSFEEPENGIILVEASSEWT